MEVVRRIPLSGGVTFIDRTTVPDPLTPEQEAEKRRKELLAEEMAKMNLGMISKITAQDSRVTKMQKGEFYVEIYRQGHWETLAKKFKTKTAAVEWSYCHVVIK